MVVVWHSIPAMSAKIQFFLDGFPLVARSTNFMNNAIEIINYRTVHPEIAPLPNPQP